MQAKLVQFKYYTDNPLYLYADGSYKEAQYGWLNVDNILLIEQIGLLKTEEQDRVEVYCVSLKEKIKSRSAVYITETTMQELKGVGWLI